MEGLKVTTRLQEAFALMARLDDQKFALFLEEVLSGLERSGAMFTSTELRKLESILGLSTRDLNVVVQACAYVFEQAARQRIATLSQVLETSGLARSKCSAFGRVWEENGAHFLAHLKEKPVSERCFLKSFEWAAEMPIGSSTEAPRKPSSKLRLDLSEGGICELAFSRAELHRFFMDLEVMQAQIDSLQQ